MKAAQFVGGFVNEFVKFMNIPTIWVILSDSRINLHLPLKSISQPQGFGLFGHGFGSSASSCNA
jgi:hypothetical protein